MIVAVIVSIFIMINNSFYNVSIATFVLMNYKKKKLFPRQLPGMGVVSAVAWATGRVWDSWSGAVG